MTVEYKDPFGPLRGTKQFIIRGQIYLSEPRELVLRPRIDEYPERWPIDPLFPQAGERSGSKAPVSQGAAPAPGGTATGIAPPPSMPPSIYPPQNPNRDKLGEFSVGNSGYPGDPSAGPALKCAPTFAQTLSFQEATPAATVEIDSSAKIPWPFRINHISFLCSSGFNTNIDVNVFVSGAQSDGTNIPIGAQSVLVGFGSSGGMQPDNQPLDIYPNFMALVANQFILVRYNNASGAAILSQVLIDIEQLN